MRNARNLGSGGGRRRRGSMLLPIGGYRSTGRGSAAFVQVRCGVKKIAIATCSRSALAEASDRPLVEAFKSVGVSALRAAWDDPGVDWSAFDCCVVRSTWDWHLTPAEFEAWIRRSAAVTRLVNDAAVLLWGLDKKYLFDLESKGVRIVESVLVRGGEYERITESVRARGWPRAVVKPTLGATAYRTSVVEAADPGTWARENGDCDGDVLVQPFLDSVISEGETSLVFIGGEFSHSVRKRAARGDFRVQRNFGGTAEVTPPVADELALARACLSAIAGVTAYARIDLVRDGAGRPSVIECEVVEPELFFEACPGSAEALARAAIGL